MPIVIKEIIVRTTVEQPIRELPADENLVRKIERRVLDRLREEQPRQDKERQKDR